MKQIHKLYPEKQKRIEDPPSGHLVAIALLLFVALIASIAWCIQSRSIEAVLSLITSVIGLLYVLREVQKRGV